MTAQQQILVSMDGASLRSALSEMRPAPSSAVRGVLAHHHLPARFYTEVLPALALALLALVCVLMWMARWNARRPERQARARRDQGLRGEEQALDLLQRSGYTVLATQHGGSLTADVDGRPWTFGLRADMLVRRRSDGAVLVAEVKTGTVAPRLEHGPTRRQLLEYTLAFRDQVQGALLVVPETGALTCVKFPVLAPVFGRRQRRWPWLFVGGIGGAGLHACVQPVLEWIRRLG